MKKIRWYVSVSLVLGAMFVWKAQKTMVLPVLGQRSKGILAEVASVEHTIISLTPDNSGKVLAYIHATENGRGLALLDLRTLERKEISCLNEVTRINAWSPDDRYLSFLQTLAPGVSKTNGFGLRESWLTFFDRQSNSVFRLTGDDNIFEQYLFWRSPSNFTYSTRWLTNDYGSIMMGAFNGTAKRISNAKMEMSLMSENLMAHLEKGNIVSLEIRPLPDNETGTNQSSRVIHQLTDFKPDDYSEIKWVRYSPETGNFLFCGKPAASNWRYLFQFSPNSKQLIQLNSEDTYNGQWLQQGAGFAYVVNTNNGFYLAVRPKDSADQTNLFVKGDVLNYTVAPSGDHIYITASRGVEPHGIWEYNLTNKVLRSLSSGAGKPFVASRPLTPREFKVKARDSVEVPCFLFKPATMPEVEEQESFWQKLRPTKKYPAVIYVPPTTAQFQKGFEERSQLLANLGFYFLAVNYRGCDGYGRDYSDLANITDAAEDVLAAREELLKDSRVDKNHIFLCTISGGGGVTLELLATVPKLWRGVVLDKPSGMGVDQRFSPRKMPPMLIISGSGDPAFPATQKFISWATENGVEVKSVVHTNSDHFTFKVDERRDKLHQTASFMIDHCK